MNLLLYYPRLISALLFRPAPTSHATFQHWVNANVLFLWNQPWRHPRDSFGGYLLRRWDRGRDRARDYHSWPSKLLTWFFQACYVLALIVWPVVALFISLRSGRRWFTCWNNLVNLISVYAHHPHYDFATAEEPLSSTSVLIPNLYILAKTGFRMPDDKDEIYSHCIAHDIPTPRVYSATDAPLSKDTYIVKPIDGSAAKGIFLTTDPEPHLSSSSVVVQEVIHNAPELQKIWGTQAVGTLRCFTIATTDGSYQIAAAVFRVPVGDSFTDNFSSGNAYTVLDCDGIMGPLYVDRISGGRADHPTSSQQVEGIAFPRFSECVEMAYTIHDRLANGLPFLNSDIALTADGPVLVEVNRAPGQYRILFHDGYSRPIVDALCRGIAAATRRSSSLKMPPIMESPRIDLKGTAA